MGNKRRTVNRVSVVETRMLRLMSDKTRKDKIRNEDSRNNLGIAPTGDKM